MALKAGDTLVLRIEKLSFGGAGIARSNNFVVFVPNTAPGDVVEVKITKAKERFSEAQVVKIIESSPERRTPPCEYFGECGGCQWQHLSYKAQTSQKKLIVEELFQRHLKNWFNKPVRFFSSTREFNYRHRIRLHWDGNVLGYYKRGTHEIIPITQCQIAETEINEQLKNLNRKCQQDFAGRKGSVDIVSESGGPIKINWVNEDNDLAFTQVNQVMNETLVECVCEAIAGQSNVVYDLYCGDGNFCWPVAKKTKAQVIGVEINPQSILRANEKKSQMKVDNINFVESDVKHYLSKIKTLNSSKSAFVLDPPRAGCAPEIINQTLNLKPYQIIYVSCDPMTLVRDLRLLSDHYELQSIDVVDMFPQTFHIECVVALSLRSS